MTRRSAPLDPASGPIAVFAQELRSLRDDMGAQALTLDEIQQRENLPRSTLYAALEGKRLPRREVVAALARSWGGDETTWLAKRSAVEDQLAAQAAGSPHHLQDQLRELHQQVQAPPLSELVKHTDTPTSASTFHNLLTQTGAPQWSAVERFVLACQRYVSHHRLRLTLPTQIFDLGHWRTRYDLAIPKRTARGATRTRQTASSKVAVVPPWPSDWDTVAVGMVASGLVALSQELERKGSFPVPYPVALQRGLDRLAAMAMVTGDEAPRSVMDLADWARRPFAQWPIRPSVEGMNGDEVLLIEGKPSKACLEWAVISGDVEGEIRERLLIHGVLDVCKAHDDQDAYVRFRRLLVERPAMSERDLALTMAKPQFALVAQHLRGAYRPASAEALIDGEAVVCGGCGHLWTVDDHGVRRCHEWDCPAPSTIKTRLPAAEGVVWLSRELRMFVSGPGRAELRIAKTLERAGVTVRLWPNFDACDLFPVQVPWAADVKSWANPVRLAWRLTERPFVPPRDAERGFIVIAREQTTGRPEYLRALRNHCSWLKGQSRVEVVTEKTYTDRVIHEARKGQS